jgi:hypothetical protein
MPNPKFIDREAASAFIRRTICPEADSNVKGEMSESLGRASKTLAAASGVPWFAMGRLIWLRRY